MTVSESTHASKRRNPVVIVLGGCVLLGLCTLIVCVASVGFWLYTRPEARTAQLLTADAIRAELVALPAGTPSGGDQVFTTAGCRACHSLEPGVPIVGPSLSGIASNAATRKPDYTAEMYLYESIIAPKAFVVAGFSGDVMPEGFQRRLTPQQIADLVAFLMSK